MAGYSVKRIVGIGAVLLVALGGVWAGWQHLAEPGSVLSRALRYFKGSELPAGFASGNGRIEATEYDIATKRAGRIAAVLVAEGDMVQVGQVLARMDTQDLEADLREAQAQATQAREDRRRAVAAIAQRESELRGAAAAVALRQSELRRADAAIAPAAERSPAGRRRDRPARGRARPGPQGAPAHADPVRQGPDRPPEARRGPDAEADGGSRARPAARRPRGRRRRRRRGPGPAADRGSRSRPARSSEAGD